MSRIGNLSNRHQGKYKKVLCVCSGGLLRSPTAAVVLSQEPFNFNTRSAGLNLEYALNVVDMYLLEWADEIVCMEPEHKQQLEKMLGSVDGPPIRCLDIDDIYPYRDPELMKLIAEKYDPS